MAKYLSRLLPIALALLLITPSAHAQGLTIIGEDAPPNSYMENSRPTGRAVEIVRSVLDETGMAGTPIEIFPWARGYSLLQSQNNVVLFPTSRTTSRENLFKWAGPIYENKISIYKLRARADIAATRLEDLKRYTIGTGSNDIKMTYLEEKGFSVAPLSNEILNIRKLFAGRIDLVAYADVRFVYDLKRGGFDRGKVQRILTLTEISKPAYVAFSRGVGDGTVARFQAGFDAIKKKGILGRILSEWN